MTKIGDRLPEFLLRDDRGDPWPINAERDRPLVLIFHRHFY